MKINYYLMLGAMVAVSAVAQDTNSPLPPLPAPAGTEAIATPPPAATETNAPAKKSAAKHHKKLAKKSGAKSHAKAAGAEKPALSEAAVTLVPGMAEVVASDLNVRGQAGLKGEVVAHLQKGDTVTVLAQINLDTHKADEPAQWAKIALPQGSDVWIRTSFIKADDKTVLPKKLNLRAGPSEDYSVVGVIERGTVVNELGAKGDWSKIEAPSNTFGFVAAKYLKQEASGNTPITPAPSSEAGLTATTTTTVAEPSPILNQMPPPAPPVQPLPEPPNNNTALLPPPIASENNVPPANAVPAPAEDTSSLPPPPRIVTHEGYVRDSISLVAPTYFELYDPTTQNAIDYLHSTTTNLDLARYNGFEIIVTGEEGLDARWKDTPVLSIQRIYVVSTNAPVVPILKSPRASTMH